MANRNSLERRDGGTTKLEWDSASGYLPAMRNRSPRYSLVHWRTAAPIAYME